MGFLRYIHSCCCGRFRSWFLLAILLVFFVQCLIAYYILLNVETSSLVGEVSSVVPVAFSDEIKHIPNVVDDHNLSCKIRSKIALSAIQRTTTQQCKDEITDIACKLQFGTIFKPKLPTYCVRNLSTVRRGLGCYLNNGETQLLPTYGVKLHSATIDKCIDLCIQHSLPYAGLQNAQECYCGPTEPSKTLVVPSTYCHLPCDGNSSQICGGKDSLSIYDTGTPLREPAPLRPSNSQSNGTTIAFVLTVNGRALRHVIRLLRLIYRASHFYYIHVDSRQDYLFRSLLHLEKSFPNIHIIRKRRSTIWGGASLLDVLIDVIEEALHQQWDFILNLSESDFPVRSIEELEKFLAANKGRNFLKSHGRKVKQFIQKQGLDRVFHQCENRMWRIGDRKLPAGIRIDGGSDWFVLSRPFAQYATADDSELSKGLRQFFHYTLLPAESFFHILLLNSPLCSTYADNNLRMTLWRRSQGCLCQHKKVVDWCGCSPMVFRTADWPQLEIARSKGNIFFARKFEASVDQTVINRLEEVVRNETVVLPSWNLYWESVYHAADVSPQPKHAVLFSAASFMRIAVKLVSQDHCQPEVAKLISVTSYFKHDHYEGDLFLWNLEEPDNSQMEVLVRPITKTTIRKRFSLLQVGSDFDPKEQLLRNRLGVLSQKSEPVLFYKLVGTNNASHVKFVWVDPRQKVRAVHTVNITENSSIGHSNLDVSPPLPAGLWSLYAVEDGNLVGEVEFALLPAERMEDYRNSSHHEQEYWESTLGLKKKNISKEPAVWSDTAVDKIIARFYSVQDICFERAPQSCNASHRKQCSQTQWSSLAFDPKSRFIPN